MSVYDDGAPSGMFIPDVEGMDTLRASLAYGECGLYHGPVPRRKKDPSASLGKGWDTRTFIDRESSCEWFIGTDNGIFLHAGRSGLTIFDVDDPAQVPAVLREAIQRLEPPYQTTRDPEVTVDGVSRAHYFFETPPGRRIGNSTGKLGKGWGEVRGNNGLVVVAPSEHEKAEQGGAYRWRRTGLIPMMPPEIAELLPEASAEGGMASDGEVQAFLAEHTTGNAQGLFKPVVAGFQRDVAAGGSRHDACRDALCWAMRDARAGLYPAQWAAEQLRDLLAEKVKGERRSPTEFRGLIGFAVAAAKAASPERIAKVAEMGRPRQESTRADVPKGDTVTDDDEEGWGDPDPLITYAEPLPTDALGPVLGPMVDAVAETYQVPPDIAVTMALPLIACAAAGRWSVNVRDGWTESVGLATLSVLGSSGGKSPTLRKLAEPLQEFEIECMDAGRGDYAESKARSQVLADRAEKLRKEVAKTDESDLIPGSNQHQEYRAKVDAYVQACRERDEHVVAAPPRFMIDDVTPEALAQVMHQQDGAIGIVSDEAGIFGTLSGRYNPGQVNLDVVLKGVSGTRIQIDRKGSETGPVIINHPVLSISVAVQPGLMARLGDTPQFRESGMLGRFLPVMPRSIMGMRKLDTPGVPWEVDGRWREAIRELAQTALNLRRAGARRTLEVKPDAVVLLNDFRAALEPQFLEGGRLADLTDFGGKLAGSAVRIAACLTLLADPEATVIDGPTMRDALRVADAYVEHARTVFSTLTGGDPNAPLSKVVAWLTEQNRATVTHRELHQALKHYSWARKTEGLQAAMETLAAMGYVKQANCTPSGSKGGRPSKGWAVNPAVLKTPQNPSAGRSEAA
jgi:hypothetical protein